MGLDITAYGKVKFVECSDSDEIECKWAWGEDKGLGDFTVTFINEYFPLHSEGLLSGVYTYDDCVYGGSWGYSRWSNFRNELARIAGYTPMTEEDSPEEWDNYTKSNFLSNPYQARVFNVEGGTLFELINFSDCDGVINTTVCKKIYKDLLSVTPEFEFPHQQNQFKSLLSAFKLASEEEGFVTFG